MTDFDPAEHNVAEVLEHIEEHPEQAEAVAAAEAEGKDRSTIAAAVEEAVAKKPVKASRATVQHDGTYVLQQGDSPATVARDLLGRGSMARDVVLANPDVKWRPGVEIIIPNVD